jgi:hypothetical protein
MIWTDEFLNRQIASGESDVNNSVHFKFRRLFLPIRAGVGTYILPDDILEIISVKWRGEDLDPLTQGDLIDLSPIYRTQQSRPYGYSLSNDGRNIIRLYPAPSITLRGNPASFEMDSFDFAGFDTAHISDLYSDDITNVVVLSAWMRPDETLPDFELPDYISQPLMKYYCAWKAYRIEGPGQRLDLSDYFKGKFEDLLENFREINDYTWASLTRILGEDTNYRGLKPARPVLPSSFREI